MYDYVYTDKVIRYIRKALIKLWNDNGEIKGFDELNVLKRADTMYAEVEKIALKAYQKLIKKYGSDTDFLPEFLSAINATLGYSFNNELERKKYRFAESMVAVEKDYNFKHALALVALQLSSMADLVTDEAVLQKYLENGYRQVKWVTERDGKVCEVCKSRDGKIYPINKIPEKPHINCRCRFEGVRE